MEQLTVGWVQLVLCLSVVVLAAGYDVRRGQVPNWLTFPAMAIGLTLGMVGGSWSGLGWSIGGLSLGAALLGVLYLAGGMGAGDVKLLAAVGALQGPMFVAYTFVFMGIIGGVLALYVVVRRWRYVSQKGLRAAGSFPYGPAIALGTVIAVMVGM